MAEKHLFTCKDCGSHDLVVVCEYTLTRYFESTLYCKDVCEETNDGLAAVSTSHKTDAYKSWGKLDDEHRWDKEEEEIAEEGENEADDDEVFCEKCVKDAQDNDWEIVEEEPEIDEDSYEFYVYCGGCEREIEFGYSHPERGGRIWPAECTDFNPWKCWPDKKYLDKWKGKGWLRPNNTENQTS